MDGKSLYTKILQLTPEWSVSAVALDEATGQVQITLEVKTDAALKCPRCGGMSPRYDTRYRRWRHLDTCQFQTIVEAEVPRIRCPTHGCITLPVPWAGTGSRYTELFEMAVLKLLKMASISAVSRHFQLSWNAIDGILQRAVARGIARQGVVSGERLAVDEVAFRKGREFITLVSMPGQVVSVEDGHSADSLASYLRRLSVPQKQAIKTLTMDLSQAYISAARKHRPAPRQPIAFDPFHIAQKLHEALHLTRKREAMALDPSLREEAHRTRYLWLTGHEYLDGEAFSRLQWLSRKMLNTSLVWLFKERARRLWRRKYSNRTKGRWLEWVAWARATRIKALMAVANTIEDKLWGILNAQRERVSNAGAEGLNK